MVGFLIQQNLGYLKLKKVEYLGMFRTLNLSKVLGHF